MEEPLLPAEQSPPPSSIDETVRSVRCRPAALGLALVAYVAVGAVERVCFTRMTAKLADDVLFMHTLLAALSMALFIVLWMARAQNGREPIAEQLQRLHPTALLQMALLDATHTILALDGAAGVAGTTQAVLLQGAVPIHAALRTAPAESDAALCGVRRICVQLKSGLAYFSFWSWLSSGRWCRQVGVLLIVIAMVAAAAVPDGGCHGAMQVSGLYSLAARAPHRWQSEAFGSAANSSLAVVTLPEQQQQQEEGEGAGNGQRRATFILSLFVGGVAAMHKQRCLSRTPTDVVIFNAWLAFSQLIAGLIVAPPLLLVLHAESPVVTLGRLAHGLRCCTAGFAPLQCSTVPSVAGFAPLLLMFFIMSTMWSTIAYIMLHYGNQALLTIGSALLLPVTLLAFLRPIPLPFSWAAPPEPLSHHAALAAVGMIFALTLFHGGTLREIWRAERRRREAQAAADAADAERGAADLHEQPGVAKHLSGF
ncbi:hypothetical protein AB1Y20_014328 [Prymnesium parvum]|uniref:Alpha-1,3-glucosyltransferase n=1 Tax=Prymnesium parvum TaxID=97485 RepID=A0AB34IDP7_PRYPA